MLLELAKESKGLGWPVAVYPFQSNIRGLSMAKVDANIAIANLQEKCLVRLEERAGVDDMKGQPSLYPVYVVTTNGFTETLWLRQDAV